jgi:hypothetical protein
MEQMTANEWISFERAVSCLTGQKDLMTAADARRTLLDAVCAGKIHIGDPNAVQCLDASSRDDWHWSVADFRALVEHGAGLESVLKNTYFARDNLLPWMKGCGFEPTADIQGGLKTSPDVSGGQTAITEASATPQASIPAADEYGFRNLPDKRPKPGRRAEIMLYNLLLAKHRDRKIPPAGYAEILKYAQGLLNGKIKQGDQIDPSLRTLSYETVRRVFGVKP